MFISTFPMPLAGSGRQKRSLKTGMWEIALKRWCGRTLGMLQATETARMTCIDILAEESLPPVRDVTLYSFGIRDPRTKNRWLSAVCVVVGSYGTRGQRQEVLRAAGSIHGER